MDNSLREAMLQMVNLQAQQLNVMNQMNSTMHMGSSGGLAPTAASLTSYTSYATPYQGPANPFSPPAGATAQFSTYASQIAPNGVSSAVKQYIMTPSGQMSAEQRQLSAANLSGGITNAGIAGVGAVAGGAAQFGSMMAVPGLAASIGVGAVGGALTGAVTAVALDQAQQNQAYNKYLLQNSYRFINPMESTNDRGLGGFSMGQRQDLSNSLRNFDVKSNITDKQTMDLLQTFTEGDLMKSSSDLKSFEKKFGQLTEYVKSASITLNTTFKQTAELMSEMEKRGILSQNFDYFSSLAKGVGSYTGQSSLESMQSISNAAGTMVSSGSTASMQVATKNAAYYTKFTDDIYERGKSAAEQGLQNADSDNYNYIVSAGGKDQAQAMAINASKSAWQSQQGLMTAMYVQYGLDSNGNFSEDLFKKNVSGKSWSTLTSGSSSTLQGLASNGTLDWYMKKAQAKFEEDPIALTNAIFANADPTQSAAQNLARYGGLDYNNANFIASLGAQDTTANRTSIDSAAKRQQILANMTAQSRGAKDTLRNVGAGIMNGIGNIIAPGQGSMDRAVQSWSDWWNGVPITLATLSGADYSTSERIKSFDDVEEETRKLGVLTTGTTANDLIGGQYSGVLNQTVGETKSKIQAQMDKISKNDPKYEKYNSLLTKYDTVLAGAKGMTEVGNVLSMGMSKHDKWWWDRAYSNTNWDGMTLENVEANEKKIVSYTKEQIRELGGDKTKVDKFLQDTDLAGFTGHTDAYWSSKIKNAKDDDKLTDLVEEIMTDLNKKSNEEAQNTTAVDGTNDTAMNANTVMIYAGSVVNNSNTRGTDESDYGILPQTSSTMRQFYRG